MARNKTSIQYPINLLPNFNSIHLLALFVYTQLDTIPTPYPLFQRFCVFGTLPDQGNAVRITLPWKEILSTTHAVPLRVWLGEWLTSAPTSPEDLPVITLFGTVPNHSFSMLPKKVSP